MNSETGAELAYAPNINENVQEWRSGFWPKNPSLSEVQTWSI